MSNRLTLVSKQYKLVEECKNTKIGKEGNKRLLVLIMAIDNENERNKVEMIYNRYYGTMFYTANGILNDQGLAEDAISEAFIRIINNIEKIGEVDCYQTRAYIRIIVRNISLDIVRRLNRKRTVLLDNYNEVPDLSDPIFENISTKDVYKRIVESIGKLHSNYSDILYLKLEFHYSIKEISEVLNISEDNAKKRLSRARGALMVLLRKEEDLYGRKNAK